MNKEQATELLHNNVSNINLRKHCYAVSYAMVGIYDYLNQKNLLEVNSPDRNTWEVFGLIHDSDYELTKDDWSKHTVLLLDWLKILGVEEEDVIYKGIQTHNAKHTGLSSPVTQMEWALECCDELTGFIVACALVLPSKKLADVTSETVKKRMKEKAFARAVDRLQIEQCADKLRIPLMEFIEIAVESMKKHSSDLGL